MTTSADIANRALGLLGTRTTVTSAELVASSTNEAIQLNNSMGPVEDWCFGLTNWNFARATAVLSSVKGPTPSSPPGWTSTYPSPPWLYEYTLPSDFINAVYLTNSTAAITGAGYLGEARRFVIAFDTITAVQQRVLLTNESSAVLIYTARVTDPTAWPWHFERLTVTAIAATVCMALTGNIKLYHELLTTMEQQIQIALQANAAEGLTFGDSTPEWIQAIGINYPYRRIVGDGGHETSSRQREPK